MNECLSCSEVVSAMNDFICSFSRSLSWSNNVNLHSKWMNRPDFVRIHVTL